MNPKGNKYKRCIYAYEFSDNHVYVGLTYNLEKSHKKRMLDNRDTVLKYIKLSKLNPLLNQLTNYVDVVDAIKLEGEYVEKYRLHGWNILNRSKTGSIGGNIIKWNFENIKNESLKFNNKSDFRKNNISAYRSAIKNNWIDIIFKK